ncbi:hypothetical protein ACIPUB_17375 [Paeniglutamicibacter sp. ORCA_105]
MRLGPAGWNWNFAAQHLLAGIHRTGARFLLRLKNGRKLPVLEPYPDGS